MKVAIFEVATGRILRILSAGVGGVGINVSEGQDFIEVGSNVMDDTHYVESFTAVAMPERPSIEHRFNYETKQWYDPRSLATLKTLRRGAINVERDRRETFGFPYLGKVFDSDQRSVSRITTVVGAATAALMMGQTFSREWTTADNSMIELTAQDIMGLPVALATYAGALHDTATALKSQIDAATTPEEVAAVVWPD